MTEIYFFTGNEKGFTRKKKKKYEKDRHKFSKHFGYTSVHEGALCKLKYIQ